MKINYTSKLIRKIQRIRIRYLCVYRTPLTHRTSNRPPPAALSINSGTGNGCPDRKMLYIKVAPNGSTVTNTLPAYPPHPSNIPNIEPFPPPDTLSGNHPGAGIHPQMNFRSEQRTHVRASITFHLSCSANV